MTWTAVLATAAGCYLLKLAGLLVPDRWLEGAVVSRVLALMPVALLAALAAVQAIAVGDHLRPDARSWRWCCARRSSWSSGWRR